MVALTFTQKVLIGLFILTALMSVISLLWIMVEQPGHLRIKISNHTKPKQLPEVGDFNITNPGGNITQIKSSSSLGLTTFLNLTYLTGVAFITISAICIWRQRNKLKAPPPPPTT